MKKTNRLGPNEYQCAVCEEIFEKGLPEEEVIAEKNEIWGDIPLEECDLVCDDCWNVIKPKNYPPSNS